MVANNTALSIAILSGKGGVGKSNIALNLALALNSMKARTLIVDCDLCLANLDVLLGMHSTKNVFSLLEPTVDMAEVVLSVRPGLDLLPALTGVTPGIELEKMLPEVLANKIPKVAHNYEFIILDVGAGIAPSALTFGAMAMFRTIVITPEPTSLTDSYALIKVLANKYSIFDHFIVANQIVNQNERDMAFNRLASACNHFLGINPTLLGGVRLDKNVIESVRRQRPLFTEFPNSKATEDILALANKFMQLYDNMRGKISNLSPIRLPESWK